MTDARRGVAQLRRLVRAQLDEIRVGGDVPAYKYRGDGVTSAGPAGDAASSISNVKPDLSELLPQATSTSASSDDSKPGNSEGTAAVTTRGGKTYVGDPNLGLAGKRLLQMKRDLQTYLDSHVPDLRVKLGNNGVVRALEDVVRGGPGRSKTSKHGLGLAIDLTISTRDVRWSGVETGRKLAAIPELAQAIRAFVKTQPDIRWGGDFGGDRAVQEFHHFEIQDAAMGRYLTPLRGLLASLRLSTPTRQSDLSDVYAAVLKNA